MSNSQRGGERIHAVDYAKGILVLLMIVYHTMNYLGFETAPHRYLGFLPSSFIFITGYLIWQVYAQRMAASPAVTTRRLVTRGCKLIALFTVMNLGARMVWADRQLDSELNRGSFFADWWHIYVTGNAPGIAFEVLLPIAYVLLIAPALLHLAAGRRRPLYLLTEGLFLLCVGLNVSAVPFATLYFIVAGMIGMSCAAYGMHWVDDPARSAGWIIGAAALYAAVVTLGWDNYPAQILVTVTCLLGIYLAARRSTATHWLSRQVVLLGQYSLLAYIIQIVILQASKWLIQLAPVSLTAQSIFLLILVTVATWLSIWLVDRARTRSRAVDNTYRLIFA